jgi:hypothetical protein
VVRRLPALAQGRSETNPSWAKSRNWTGLPPGEGGQEKHEEARAAASSQPCRPPKSAACAKARSVSISSMPVD